MVLNHLKTLWRLDLKTTSGKKRPSLRPGLTQHEERLSSCLLLPSARISSPPPLLHSTLTSLDGDRVIRFQLHEGLEREDCEKLSERKGCMITIFHMVLQVFGSCDENNNKKLLMSQEFFVYIFYNESILTSKYGCL